MSKEIDWSTLKYDLKTALDLLGLPCFVKAADDTTESCSKSRATCIFGSTSVEERTIRLVSEISIYIAHARILQCSDWTESLTGNDVHDELAEYRGREILIPLNYNGQARIHQRDVGKEYCNISEVLDDFPTTVKVEMECACASPGQAVHQVVKAGTILELDRVTESSCSIRGIRQAYLITIDRSGHHGNRELAFPLFSTVHFTKVCDDSTYTVKEIVDRLPLPQTIQFVSVNPYDIATADDHLASDLLRMLSGLVQITEIRRTQCIVGFLQQTEDEPPRTVVIPKTDDLLNDINVYIPDSCVVDNRHDDEMTTDNVDLDIVRNKLYLQYADQSSVLILKTVMTSHDYNAETIPNSVCSLTSSISTPEMSTDELDMGMSRKRCMSSGDSKKQGKDNLPVSATERQTGGARDYLSHIASRIKLGVSQVWLGLEKNRSAVPSSPDSPRNSSKHTSRDSGNLQGSLDDKYLIGDTRGFVCYLDERLDLKGNKKLERYVATPCPPEVVCGDSKAIYATVDFTSKHYSSIEVRESPRCRICQENTKNS